MRLLLTVLAVVISFHCFGQATTQPGEYLRLDWPDSEGWKVGDDQTDGEQHVIDLVRGNETVDNWTELGNMTLIRGIKNVPVDVSMQVMYQQAQKAYPKAKLTFIKKDEHAKFPWIIFMIESPASDEHKIPESQVWYLVQGSQALYSNFRAIKKATIPKDLKEKWIKFFETARVVTHVD